MNSKKKKKLLFEAKRKFFHALGIIYVIFYLIIEKFFGGKQVALLFLLSVLLTFVVIEFFRIMQRVKIPIFHFLWRPSEENSLGGQVYYILGLIISLAIFDKDIAIAAILMTIFGDMAAAIFGIAFGKNWIKSLPETAWEGVIAEFIIDLIICALILQNLFISILMALIATIAETIFPHIDDNLAIPVFSGFFGQCLKILFF